MQLTSFVGREEELAGVAEALDERRLVTLTGTGGVGKTRLAMQVAADVPPGFRDGAWFCGLAAAVDGESMAQLVAAEFRGVATSGDVAGGEHQRLSPAEGAAVGAGQL